MTTVELPVRSEAENTIDLGTIWKEAIREYEEITKVNVQSLTEANNVEEILNDIHEREKRFKSYRNNGSKLERFRTLVMKSLRPIQKVCDVVASVVSTVKEQLLPAR